MSKMKTLFVCMILIALPASQVSADVDETNSSPEVTIGFGNVTNDTMEFTMDTSVDVYIFQVTLAWETGAVYCGISGSGGLAEEHNLFVSVLYAGCLTTGYYYGAQGNYWIPSGSNDTLTSIYYQSNSPEVCIGNATYVVMLPDGEFETRQADFDPNDCLTYTMYETSDDLWYELDEDGNDEGDNETDSWSPVFISFIADSSEINDIWFEIYDCSGNLYLQAGAPYEGYTELPNDFIVIIVDASGDGWNEGSNIYIDGYGNFSVENGYYDTISNCDGNDTDGSL